MSLHYNKNNGEHSGDSFWTSYSDLFLGLSCIFLLLYVVSSMRQGADVIKQQVQNEQLAMEVNDLKNQLKAYEDIKNQYMKDQASQSEKTEYNELIDKLSLLKEETMSENERLKKELLANESKEQSLNKYQQMVRNMLNANKLAKVKINTREDVIEEKSQVIVEKESQVKELEGEVTKNKQLIAQGERQISEAKKQLDYRVQQLKNSFKNNKITRAILEKRIAQANLENQQKVKALQVEKQQYQKELVGINNKLQEVASTLDETKSSLDKKNSELAQVASNLNETRGTLEKKKSELAQVASHLNETKGSLERKNTELAAARSNLDKKTGEAESLQNKLKQTAADTEARLAGMRADFEAKQGQERAAFTGELNKLKLGVAERERREAAFKAEAAQKERDMNQKMSGLQGQLDKAQAEIEARQSVARDIKNQFAKAGIKAEINGETGEVLLDFGQSYFDNDSAKLKAEMKSVIEKAIPVYAQSLLGNAKIAEKVSSVEIIGFASPTYKGKFVDPNSSNKEDQNALKYNMDLSYSRAKSIFNYIVDNRKNSATQKELIGLMKVSGRSFLEVAKVKRDVAPEDFCRVNDCKKAQRVVIRFNMDQSKK